MKILAWIEKFKKNSALRHKIGAKLSLNLIVISFLGFVLISTFTKIIIDARFAELERAQLAQHQAQLASFLDSQKAVAKNKTKDWANWTDTYEFILDGNQDYITANLDPESLEQFGVSGLSFVNFEKGIVFASIVDDDQGVDQKRLLEKFKEITNSNTFREYAKKSQGFESFVKIGNCVFVVALEPVRMNDLSGKINGYLVTAKDITALEISKALHTNTKIDFVPQKEDFTARYYSETISASQKILSIDKIALGRLTTDFPRNLNAVKNQLWLILNVGLFLLLFIIITSAYVRLDALVVEPLSRLSNHLNKISKNGRREKFGAPDSNDEIGTLIITFNQMVDRLDDLQIKLEQKSFELGKDQNQIDVMHNVKNALSPIRVVMSKLGDVLVPANTNFVRALDELANPETPVERRAKLHEFAKSIHDIHNAEMNDSQEMIRRAEQSLSDIVMTIDTLKAKKDADNSGKTEAEICNINSVISKSLDIARFGKNKVKVEFNPNSDYFVAANRIIMAQVFDNIITNSIEAIEQSQNQNGEVSVEIKSENQGKTICINIRDNGDGLSQENAQKVFSRGFSTRKFKSGGLGLHWCANAINALGGAIAINNNSNGKGATVSIKLPLEQNQKELAA